MSDVPDDLKYTSSHEWVRYDADTCTVGITSHAQELLGDLVFVELPELQAMISAGDETGVVESVKAASDIYAPVTGTITAVNDALVEQPELINQDPYGKGWLYKINVSQPDEVDALLDAQQYTQKILDEG